MTTKLGIPEILRDNTTIVKNHSIKTHIFCILLRILLRMFYLSILMNRIIFGSL